MSDKLKVLHLEDNLNDAELVKIMLEDAGLTLDYLRVDNRMDFINGLSGEKYDIILSDYNLPSYNGLAALDEAVRLQPETPFIFVSGTLGEDVAVESLKKGATDYVLKSRLNRLISTVQRASDEVKEIGRRKKAEERYKTLIESARDIIFTISPKRIITSLNNAFEAITGWNCGEWIGKDYRKLIHPDDIKNTEDRLLGTLMGRTAERYEVRILRKNGEYFTGEFLTSALFEDGNITEILGLVRDVTERKRTELLISNSLHEKETLLKEIHHRVKNNLQIISSLLKLQLNNITDEYFAGVINDLRTRIMAMSIVHKKLYQSDSFSKFDFKGYIEQFIYQLIQIYDIKKNKISINIESDEIEMDIDTAIPCGLIINEIVSNSIKHAFKDSQNAVINLKFNINKDNTFHLNISDNGTGLPENINVGESSTLGLLIINTLVSQLGGKMEIIRDHGTTFDITFSSLHYTKRI